MELNQDTMDLICKLEYCIGDTCCNIHSYNGWTNEWDTDFRYPVVASNEGRYYGHLEELGLKPGSLATMCSVLTGCTLGTVLSMSSKSLKIYMGLILWNLKQSEKQKRRSDCTASKTQ